MADLPGNLRNIRFYSGRPIPRGTKIRVEMMGPMVFVEGSVPGGPVVSGPCAVVDREVVLDDHLFFEHEFKRKTGIVGG